MRIRSLLFGAATSLALVSPLGAQGALGPLSKFYLLDGDAATGSIIQGLTNTNFGLNGRDYGIAVYGGIINTYNTNGGTNNSYNTSGSFLGSTSAAPFGFNSILDGTTDGTWNYGITYSTPGNASVYRAGLDWSNPTFLFTASQVGSGLGLTYDPTTNSLWASGDVGGSWIFNYDLTGNLLGSFDTGIRGVVGALGMDYADGTLWFVDRNGSNRLMNYSTSGTFIGAAGTSPLGNPWGGEFEYASRSTVPEPATFALLVPALLGVGVVARRRRQA